MTDTAWAGSAERFAACGHGDLGESRGGQDGLAVHLVVGEPWADVGADVGLPDVVVPGGQLHVRAEQRVAAGRAPHGRIDPRPRTVRVLPRLRAGRREAPAGGSSPVAPIAASWVWKNRVWSWSRFIAEVTGPCVRTRGSR